MTKHLPVAGFVLVVSLVLVALCLLDYDHHWFRAQKETTSCSDGAYTALIVDVLAATPVSGRDAMNATLVFSSAVPNGTATLVITLNGGGKVLVHAYPVTQNPDGSRANLGQPTTRLAVQWSPEKDQLTEKDLQFRPVRLYSHEYPRDLASNPYP